MKIYKVNVISFLGPSGYNGPPDKRDIPQVKISSIKRPTGEIILAHFSNLRHRIPVTRLHTCLL
jgi:hypothetical protein